MKCNLISYNYTNGNETFNIFNLVKGSFNIVNRKDIFSKIIKKNFSLITDLAIIFLIAPATKAKRSQRQ